MKIGRWCIWILCLTTLSPALLSGQVAPGHPTTELRLHLISSLPNKHRHTPAVVWLEPVAGTPAVPFVSKGHYALLQKDRTFSPHLQVIPVGSSVQFPNDDPFFHNVFSLFNGRRFDLGLYEAGSSKSVTFSREGVSYIFCNIHPEMSAVIVSLTTPLYAVANATDSLMLSNIPPGEYKMNLWVEGVQQTVLDGLSRDLHLTTRPMDLGDILVPISSGETLSHANKFGRAYDQELKSPY